MVFDPDVTLACCAIRYALTVCALAGIHYELMYRSARVAFVNVQPDPMLTPMTAGGVSVLQVPCLIFAPLPQPFAALKQRVYVAFAVLALFLP